MYYIQSLCRKKWALTRHLSSRGQCVFIKAAFMTHFGTSLSAHCLSVVPHVRRCLRVEWCLSRSESWTWRTTACAGTITWTCMTDMSVASGSAVSAACPGLARWLPPATRCKWSWCRTPTQLGVVSWPLMQQSGRTKEVMTLFHYQLITGYIRKETQPCAAPVRPRRRRMSII